MESSSTAPPRLSSSPSSLDRSSLLPKSSLRSSASSRRRRSESLLERERLRSSSSVGVGRTMRRLGSSSVGLRCRGEFSLGRVLHLSSIADQESKVERFLLLFNSASTRSSPASGRRSSWETLALLWVLGPYSSLNSSQILLTEHHPHWGKFSAWLFAYSPLTPLSQGFGQAVVARAVRANYGVTTLRDYDPLNLAHRGRSVFTEPDGRQMVSGCWATVIPKVSLVPSSLATGD